MGRNMGLRKVDDKPVYRPPWIAIVVSIVLWAVLLTIGAAMYRGIAMMIADAGLR